MDQREIGSYGSEMVKDLGVAYYFAFVGNPQCTEVRRFEGGFV